MDAKLMIHINNGRTCSKIKTSVLRKNKNLANQIKKITCTNDVYSYLDGK